MEAVIVNLDAWKREHQRPAHVAGDDIVEAWSSLMRAIMYWQWELWGAFYPGTSQGTHRHGPAAES